MKPALLHRLFFLLLAGMIFAVPARAQRCEVSEAQEMYERGAFRRAIDFLESDFCDLESLPKWRRILAYEILALSWLEESNEERAEEYKERILALERYYMAHPSHPLEYRELFTSSQEIETELTRLAREIEVLRDSVRIVSADSIIIDRQPLYISEIVKQPPDSIPDYVVTLNPLVNIEAIIEEKRNWKRIALISGGAIATGVALGLLYDPPDKPLSGPPSYPIP